MAMPAPEDEIALIETFANTKVIGVTINHEGMTDAEVSTSIAAQSQKLDLPVTDALSRPVAHLVNMVVLTFPRLRQGRVATAL